MRITWTVAAVCCLCGLAGRANGQGADTFLERHRAASEHSPSEVTLEVTLAEARTSYRVGEPIDLRLQFQKNATEKYYFDNTPTAVQLPAMWDRVTVDRPQDVSDPTCGCWIEGVVGSYLSAGPDDFTQQTVVVTLNDLLQFRRPGRYRVFVESVRPKLPPGPGSNARWVVSNVLEFTLAQRDVAWERSVLSSARVALASPIAAERLAAVRRLRILGTPETTVELARVFVSGDRQLTADAEIGLLSAPDPDAAIDALLRSRPQAKNAAGVIVLLARIDLRRTVPSDCCCPVPPAHKAPCFDAPALKRFRELIDCYRARVTGTRQS
jgi:hypothetical protein